MASQVLRRIVQGAGLDEVIRRVNAALDMLNGNSPGRIKLRGDDGEARNPIGGASVSSGNYALDVKAASGFHGQFTHSTGSPIILAIADSGNVTASAINSGDVGITGNLTIVGVGRLIKGDFSNGTIANRVTFETSTATASTLMQMRPSSGGVAAGWNIYNTNALTGQRLQLAITATHGILAVESTGGGALPLNLYTNGTLQAQLSTAGVFYAQNLIAGATALIGTEKLYVAGNALLSNASYLNGRNAANSADVNLLRLNSSDIIETGQTGTRHNLLGTVVAPTIDPPTVNGQVTAGAVAAAWAHFTVSGGAVTLRDSYNVAGVTYNAAGDFTVAWDRDFSSAYYSVAVTVEDNGAALLAPKVNSQAAGSADIWVYNVAAAKTDPDAVSVVCFGTLS